MNEGKCDCCGLTDERVILEFNNDNLCYDCFKYAERLLKKVGGNNE